MKFRFINKKKLVNKIKFQIAVQVDVKIKI